VSSVAAIGRTQGNEEFITEQTEWKNGPDNSKYAIGKYLAELEVWRGVEEGLKAAMINPTVILGAGNWKHTSNTLFRKFSNHNKFYTKGGNGFVDVRDVVKALLAVSDNTISGERFITVGENVSFLSLMTSFAEAFDVEPPKTTVKSWMMEMAWRIEKLRSKLTGKAPLLTKETARTSQNIWKYSNKKAKRELGLTFTPVGESIATYAEFYKRLF
jgi:nucleoside-diphosphate-sugar epimerase